MSKLSSKIIPAVALLLASCSMVNEDLEPCAPAPKTFTTVNFVYDYNMQFEDLFDKHAGSVYLYVFDNQGIFQMRRTAHRVNMKEGEVDFSMTFDESQLQPGQTYQIVAVAQGNRIGYQSSLETPGFTLQTEMVEGVSKIEDYILKLDRDDDGTFDFGVVNYKDAYGNNNQMIDTLWTTKPDEVQILKVPELNYKPSPVKEPDHQLEVTIPMMRITNSITVNLVNPAFKEGTNPDDFTFLIDFPNGNGTIDFTGKTYPAQELYYRSLRKQTIPYTPKQKGSSFYAASTRADEETYAVQAVFGVSRLQVTDGSSLQIRDPETNEILSKVDDFSNFLADFFEHGFSDNQEFLDREYDFQIDLELDDEGKIVWIQCGCAILGWAKRVYYYDLM